MSWTPDFIVEKEGFDKSFEKISSRVSNYWYNRNIFFSWKYDIIKKKNAKYIEFVIKFGSNPNKEAIKKKVEKEVEESSEYKKKSNELLKEDSLSDIFEYTTDITYYKLNDKKYYLFSPELSSQSYALKDFLDKNKVIYSTGDNE